MDNLTLGLFLYGGAVLGIGLLVGYRFGSVESSTMTFGDIERAYPSDYPTYSEPKPTTRRTVPDDAPPSL